MVTSGLKFLYVKTVLLTLASSPVKGEAVDASAPRSPGVLLAPAVAHGWAHSCPRPPPPTPSCSYCSSRLAPPPHPSKSLFKGPARLPSLCMIPADTWL